MNKMTQVKTMDCKNTEGLAELIKQVRELTEQVRELSKQVRELTEQVSMLIKGSHTHFLFKLLQVYESRATVEFHSIQKQQHRRS